MASTAVATRAAAPPAVAEPVVVTRADVEPEVKRWGPTTMATAVVVAAHAVYFGALLAAWLLSRSVTDGWVPDKVHLDLYLGTTGLATALLASACLQWAVSSARRGDNAHTIIANALGLGLTLAMANLVWYSATRIGVGAASSVYATLWFALLGSYVVAAVGAALVQAASLARAIGGQYTEADHQPVTAAALQWHALTAVWVALWLAIWVLK